MAKKKRMSSALKSSLEDLLRERRLASQAPPLRGEDRRLRPLSFGAAALDGLLAGGLPRGALSELHGPASSGRTGLAVALAARATRAGALVAWVDPGGPLRPVVRGRVGPGPRAAACGCAAAGGSAFRARWRRSASCWARDSSRRWCSTSPACRRTSCTGCPGRAGSVSRRTIEDSPTALLLVAAAHVACGPGGVSLALQPARAEWSGEPGPGRLLGALTGDARAGRHAPRGAAFRLDAV